jgi:hypothetical protein
MVKLDNVTMKRIGEDHFEQMGNFVNDRLIANYKKEKRIYENAGRVREV